MYLVFLAKRVLPVTHQFLPVGSQRRHPVRVVAVKLPRKLKKLTLLAPRFYRLDDDIRHGALTLINSKLVRVARTFGACRTDIWRVSHDSMVRVARKGSVRYAVNHNPNGEITSTLSLHAL